MFWMVGHGKCHINVTDSTPISMSQILHIHTYSLSSLPLLNNQKTLFLSPVLVLHIFRLLGLHVK